MAVFSQFTTFECMYMSYKGTINIVEKISEDHDKGVEFGLMRWKKNWRAKGKRESWHHYVYNYYQGLLNKYMMIIKILLGSTYTLHPSINFYNHDQQIIMNNHIVYAYYRYYFVFLLYSIICSLKYFKAEQKMLLNIYQASTPTKSFKIK